MEHAMGQMQRRHGGVWGVPGVFKWRPMPATRDASCESIGEPCLIGLRLRNSWRARHNPWSHRASLICFIYAIYSKELNDSSSEMVCNMFLVASASYDFMLVNFPSKDQFPFQYICNYKRLELTDNSINIEDKIYIARACFHCAS